jgi:glucose uptake protein GlcU
MKRSRFSTIAASIAIVLAIIAVSSLLALTLPNEILDRLRYLIIAFIGIVAGWKISHPSKKEEGEEKDQQKSSKPFVGIVVMVVGVMLLVGLHLLQATFITPLLLLALALVIVGLILHVRAMKRESIY